MSYTDLELACDTLVGHNITTNPDNFTGHLVDCDGEYYTIFVAKGNFSNPSEISGWISIDDHIPEENVSVIVCPYLNNFSEDFQITGVYCDGEWFCEHGELIDVTHWIPLPKQR